MSCFSIFNYNSLSPELKKAFHEALAHELSPLIGDIMKDDVLNSSAIEGFVTSSGVNNAVVSDLYSSVSGGIQVGSGNQKLFMDILNAFVETWERIIKKD